MLFTSLLPQYCADRRPVPLDMPKTKSANTKYTLFPRPTAAIAPVPRLPIIIVSTIFTIIFSRFCNVTGTAIPSIRFKKEISLIISEKTENDILLYLLIFILFLNFFSGSFIHIFPFRFKLFHLKRVYHFIFHPYCTESASMHINMKLLSIGRYTVKF